MTDLEIAWLAGYLEGEGCFTWQKSYARKNKRERKEYRYPLISVACIDRDVTEKAATIMESCKPFEMIRNQPGKPLWRTQIGGKRALAVMGLILPHMGERRSQRIRELFMLSAARPGQVRGERSYQAKLNEVAVSDIRTSPDREKRGFQMAMAKKYGVSWGTIWFVRNGLTWKGPPPTDSSPTLTAVKP